MLFISGHGTKNGSDNTSRHPTEIYMFSPLGKESGRWMCLSGSIAEQLLGQNDSGELLFH